MGLGHDRENLRGVVSSAAKFLAAQNVGILLTAQKILGF
jgi:hypothetical protein